jgi:predicted amidohydrolase
VNRVGADASDVLFTGHSAVYDAFGETITLLGEQEKVKTVVLEKVKQDEIRAKLPFLKDGDDFTLSK